MALRLDNESFVAILSKYGLGTVIAIFLTYWVTAKLESQLSLIASKVEYGVTQDTIHAKEQREFDIEMRKENEVKLFLLQRICINTSKTDSDKIACVR